ncbi:hypothetical protein C6Q12_25760 [Burkholderia multivorans]|nr:hypothetical protein C6Q12_25760 [Burkholderia multivorans]
MGEPFDPVIVTSIRTTSGRNRSVEAVRWIECGACRHRTAVTASIVDSRSKAPVAALLFFI